MIKNLLLVDDDDDDREFFLEVVGDLFPEMSCVTAVNGQDALDKLGHYRPDLIFLDLNMPLMNGRQFLAEVNKHSILSDIPVVILTTSSDRESIVETRRLGAKEFITKPDKFSGWQTILQSVFANPDLIIKRPGT